MFIYLASPYSHPDPRVREARYQWAIRATGQLMEEGTPVFSPVVHCHVVAEVCHLPTTFEFWQAYCHQMILSANALYVLCLEGWEESKGVRDEINFAEKMDIPVGLIVGGYTCQSEQMVPAPRS